jgi:hypothetical protein
MELKGVITLNCLTSIYVDSPVIDIGILDSYISDKKDIIDIG